MTALTSHPEHLTMPAGSDGSDDLMSDFEVLSANDESMAFGAVAANGPLENLHLSLPHGDGTSLSSASDDLTHQEAEERIAKVLQENANLKEKVALCTAKIQQQYDTFVTYQKQLTEAQATLKEQLSDTRRRLEEKCCLEVELRDLVEKLQKACTLHASERQAMALMSVKWDPKGGRDSAAEGQTTLSDCIDSSEVVPGLLPSKDKDMMSISHAVVKLHEEQSKTAQLTEKIDELTEQLESKTSEIKELEGITSKLRQQVSEAESRNAALTSQATTKQAELETALLEKEALVRALQGQCEGKVAEIEELRRALLTAEKNCDRARRDYAELLQTWQNYENSNDAGEQTFVRVERQSGVAASRDAERMKRQSERQAQELAERESQIEVLRQEVERLKKDLELLPPLQAQVEVYRTDYDTERNLRRQLEMTVQEHLNTIEELREQINALQGPPPELRSRNSSNSSNQRSSESNSASTQQTQQTSAQAMESLLPCPLCMEVCSTRSLYIAHVQSCADGQEVR
uniref:Putative muscle myosin heavy chain n=1 Tax=Rhipicephalus pulchellus TaxID=72859 RepID=L7LY65_RHIPC